jgi:hypothetical protein
MTQPQAPQTPSPTSPQTAAPSMPAPSTPGAPPPPGSWVPAGYGYSPQGWGPVPVGGAPAYGPPPGLLPPDPEVLLTRGLGALRAAGVLLWCLVGAHAVMAAGAIALIVVADGSGTDIADAEALGVLGLLAWFGLGTALWALLALWCSRTSLAARAAGNQLDSSSHLAWWGIFVPVAGLVLPFLAYRDAARYSQAVARAGSQPRGAGESWRSTPVPLGVHAWWVLFIASSVCLGSFSVVDPGDDLLEGIFWLATAAFGAASGVCGALSLGRLSRRRP